MKIIDQITTTVRDDIIQTIHKGSRISIAAACFSIYAYQFALIENKGGLIA